MAIHRQAGPPLPPSPPFSNGAKRRWWFTHWGDDHQRKQTARSEECEPHLLEHLSTDEDAFIRMAVAGNPNATPTALRNVFERLPTDDALEQRTNTLKRLAAHAKTPDDIIELLPIDIEVVRTALLERWVEHGLLRGRYDNWLPPGTYCALKLGGWL